MKKVALIIAVAFVSVFAFSSCEEQNEVFDQIENVEIEDEGLDTHDGGKPSDNAPVRS